MEILKKGLELSLSSKNAVNRYSLYLNLSDAYKHLGRPDEALRYYEAFHHEADNVDETRTGRIVFTGEGAANVTVRVTQIGDIPMVPEPEII